MQFHSTPRTSFSHNLHSTPCITSIPHTDHTAPPIPHPTSRQFRQLPSHLTPIHSMQYFLFFLILPYSFFFVLLHFSYFLLFLIFFLCFISLLHSYSVFCCLDRSCSFIVHYALHSLNTTHSIHKRMHTQLHTYVTI